MSYELVCVPTVNFTAGMMMIILLAVNVRDKKM